MLGLAVGGEVGAEAATVGNNTAIETISDYTGVKIPKPCTCIVAQDGTGDYDVLPNEDASEVIQRAIDYAHGKGGGEVRIREGVYRVANSIKLAEKVKVHGDGWNSTIKLDDGTNYTITLCNSKKDVVISNLTIDGNKQNNTNGSGIVVVEGSHNFLIDNVRVYSCAENGIEIIGGNYYFEIQKVHCRFNGRNGIYLGKSSYKWHPNGGIILNARCSNNGLNGIHNEFGNNRVIIGGYFESNANWGILLENTIESAIYSPWVEGNGQREGIRIEPTCQRCIVIRPRNPSLLDISDSGIETTYIGYQRTYFSVHTHPEGETRTLYLNYDGFSYVHLGVRTLFKVDKNGVVTFSNIKRGYAIIPAGQTSVRVEHGLTMPPTKVLVTPRGNVGSVWVSDVTEKHFIINCSIAPSSNIRIDWCAEV